MKATSEWLKATVRAPLEQIDREAGIIRGVIGVEQGLLKDGRGEFNELGIQQVFELSKAQPNGLKARFTHPSLSDDGLGKHLGRFKNPRQVTLQRADGPRKAVRFDLHIDPTSKNTPNGNLGDYVMDLAESDPEALGASLVLRVREEEQIDDEGNLKLGTDGEPMPPLWFPEAIHALDVVGEGAATHSFLDVELRFDDAVQYGAMLLNKQFPNETREVIRARVVSWLDRCLDDRFGIELPKKPALGTPEWVAELLKGK